MNNAVKQDGLIQHNAGRVQSYTSFVAKNPVTCFLVLAVLSFFSVQLLAIGHGDDNADPVSHNDLLCDICLLADRELDDDDNNTDDELEDHHYHIVALLGLVNSAIDGQTAAHFNRWYDHFGPPANELPRRPVGSRAPPTHS